jgi:uncharacterized protein YdaU (DUF1376 family)
MAEFPKLGLWTDAYLGDTTHLTTIEHGAYLLLLIAMWRSEGTRLPGDDKMLARYARLTAGQWARIKPVIMPFFKSEDGFITQSRLTDEANAVRQHSKKQSDKAKARHLKDKETASAAAVPESCRNDASLSLSLSHVEEPKKEGSSTSSRRASRFDEFWAAYPHRNGTKKGRASALKSYSRRVRDGVPEQAIIDGAQEAQRHPDVVRGYARDPTTWLNAEGWTDEIGQTVHQFPSRGRNDGPGLDAHLDHLKALVAVRRLE